ncbi:MAG: MSMEG_1061 family FMN-dependent PPOX-type flavoprotein [Actinomycetota bacterium]
MQFSDSITTLDGLREVIAAPSELVTAKEISSLDDYCRDFIARSPFIIIASTDGKGNLDTSPKGDPPGFVRVLDDTTLAIPERPGNRRADTLVNLVQHPHVGLIFLIPGVRNTLRVRGRAQIVRDQELRESMALEEKVPELAIVVDVTVAYFHCAKCIIRSRLWSEEQEARLGGSDDRLLAETMVKHGDLPFSVDEMQEIIVDDEVTRLY